MSAYYYLVSSLPGLVLGHPPVISSDVFLAICAQQLTPHDHRELELVWQGRAGEAASAFARAWHDVETQLRNAVARARAGLYGTEARAWVRSHQGWVVQLEKMVAEAFARPDPLEREQALDRARWQMAGELCALTPFGLESVLAYAVRLQIVTRWAAFDVEQGWRRMDGWINELEKQAQESTYE